MTSTVPGRSRLVHAAAPDAIDPEELAEIDAFLGWLAGRHSAFVPQYVGGLWLWRRGPAP